MKRIVLILALVAGTLGTTGAAAQPDTSSQCTPLAAPVVCLNINGVNLHVNYFQVQAIFNRKVPAGTKVKGWWRVRNGPNGPIIFEKYATYTVQPDAWSSWTFTAAKNYPDGYVACGQFSDTVPGGVFYAYKPCGTIHGTP